MVCHCHDPRYCPHYSDQQRDRRHQANEKYPSYLPQPYDYLTRGNIESEADASYYGPWYTGRVTWSPSSGLVGIRPVVDRYSITRYSTKDWRKKNQDVLEVVFDSSQLKHDVKYTLDSISAGADEKQHQNTLKLEERVKEVRDCKEEIESLIRDLREEIVMLTELKIKLKFALPILTIPESIAGECIDRRSTRLEPDLVNDDVQAALIKELSLIKSTRNLYVSVIEEIEKQILSVKACKDQLEYSWSDKKETCELESINVCLRNDTPIIMYHEGAARLPENQSSPESWAVFNSTLINLAKEELNKSATLRDATHNTLQNSSIRDLRTQADKVCGALIKRIEETDQCRERFERELVDILRQIAEAESLYNGLLKLQRQLDIHRKVTETRLDNKHQRPRIENCRDEPFYGLLDEVKYLNNCKTNVRKQIEDVDKVVSRLYEARCNLEYAILTKRKSLYVDQQRCMVYREKYPDAETLSGGNL